MILTTFGVAFVIASGQNLFPASVLDSIPAVRWDSLTAPEYVLTDAPSLPGKVVRDLVLVGFYESISPAARRAAIASVNGCRLGKVLLDVYVIRIPYILRRGDSTSGPLLRAIERLKRNHIVELAMVEQLDVPVTTSGRPGSSTTSRVVPARPPLGTTRSVMDSAHASDNLLASVPGIAGRTTRNTLYVGFVHNATPAQKDSALAAIDAQVIGGIYYASYGWYYVRLRNTATAPPDSAYGPLLRAERKLHSLRYVQSVMHDLVDSPIQPRSSGSVTLAPPHYFPKALFDSLGSVRGRPLSNRPYRRSIVAVEFDLRASRGPASSDRFDRGHRRGW
jgi:hypothetical protein